MGGKDRRCGDREVVEVCQWGAAYVGLWREYVWTKVGGQRGILICREEFKI